MAILSILFDEFDRGTEIEVNEAPACFVDLNLDQVVNAITARKNDYNLKPFFYLPIRNIGLIKYRQDVFRDLENKTLLEYLKSFAQKMVVVRRYRNLVDKLYYKYHQKGWFLEAVVNYCDAISSLEHDLSLIEIKSRGLLNFRDYISGYTRSAQFTMLLSDTKKLKSDLSTIQYSVIIKGNWVRVKKYESEIDYSNVVEQTFEKFKQGAAKNHKIDLLISAGMNHVEAQILDCVARLYPEIFLSLDQYYVNHSDFVDETIRVFDREIQFFISYLDYIANIKEAGLDFCLPQISASKKEIQSVDSFDLALAHNCVLENMSVVCNDFYLKGNERIIVVSGPNQGGKTTFARTFGQLQFLANLGCPIPGKEAQMYLFDKIFTHFEKEEDIQNLRGKLQDDLVRIHSILDQASPDSIIIMNEIFTSTTLKDAIFLSKQIVERIIQLDSLCICVSFIDELTSFEKTVSMVSTVVPENPAQRTFKLIRKPADGLSYAICIAEKHGLTYSRIKERIK